LAESPTSDGADIFISYAAEDRDRARRVAEYLESCGWRVWWDRKIPVGRAFDEAIEHALRQARCVVVLWTKDAVASRWVRSEASDAAQRQVLVPVLVDEATIPLEFRHLQALDLRGWKAGAAPPPLESLHDAVAHLVGDAAVTAAAGPHAVLVHSTRTIGRTLAFVAAATLFLCVVALGGWYWDAYHREISEYYANVTKRWGLPEGIGRLTAEQVSRRNESVVLVRRGRRNPAHEIRVVSSEGLTPAVGLGLPIISVNELNPLPSGGSDGPVSSELIQLTRVTFAHDANGRLLEQTGFNRGGRRLYTMHFAEPDIAEYKWHGFGRTIRESGISYVRFSRVASGPNAGLDERVQYLDDRQRPQPDVNGDFGYRLVLDAGGLITEWVNRGPDGADKANSYGVFKEVRSHDSFGSLLEAATVDERGAPKPSRIGPALTRVQYDQSGNAIRMSFFDEKAQPVVAQMAGAASIGFTYDRRGNVTSQTFFGPDQSMVVGASGFAKQTIEWQAPNRFLGRVFGANDQPIPAFDGAFEGLITLEPRGYYVETTYRNRQGNPTRAAQGCATVRLQYDEQGNLARFGCLNEQGAPTIAAEGFSHVTFTYDDFGNRVTSAFHDLQGAPRLQGETYASTRRMFTSSGLVEEETYLNAQGSPVTNRQGFARVKHAFDASGNQVATEFFDERGSRARLVDGYSAIRRRFDARRLELETVYLDSSDRPTQGSDGYATVRYEYDQRGFLTRILQFDTNGKPSRGFYGYCSARIKYSAAGQRLEMTFFDEQGAPTAAARLGSAKRRWTYDQAGRVSERSDHDLNGRPIVNAYGYSILRHRYDEHGRDAGRELLDAAGRPLDFKISVDRVARGSVASDAGLAAGDLMLTYDGQTVSTIDQFTNTFELFRGDRARELRIERGGNVLSLDVPPGRLDGLELAERVPIAVTAVRR
jgi:YD repeat-containing protein